MLAAFSSVLIPLILVIAIIWGLIRYISQQLPLPTFIDADNKHQTHSEPFPNWEIHELFSHINPDVLSRTDDGDVWNLIGNDVRDQGSLGRLKIWGRAVRDSVDSILGNYIL